MSGTTNKFVLVWALALTAFIIMGLTVPNTFSPGTTISSSEMNENFAAIEAAMDALESPTRRGTILLFARVIGDDAVAGYAPGAYSSLGGLLPVPTDLGTGHYLIPLPGGEDFDIDRHAVVITPLANAPARTYGVTEGLDATVQVRIRDDAGMAVDDDFQIVVFND